MMTWAYKRGVDIREWIQAGLPEGLRKGRQDLQDQQDK
jgi:hypothetical protein